MSPDDQRRVALDTANRRRTALKDLKAELTSGALSASDAVDDDRVGMLMVGEFLELIPGCGPIRVRAMLGELAVSTEGEHEVKLWPWSRMRDLSGRQRHALQFYLVCKEDRRPLPKVNLPAAVVAEAATVEAHVVIDWIKREFPRCSPADVERALGFNDGSVRRWMRGDQKLVKVSMLDAAFTRIGRPDLLNAVVPL